MPIIFDVLRQLWPQWLAALIVTLLCISIGLAIGWTSPYLAQLTGEEPPFPVTQKEASWIASLLSFGRIFGAIIGPFAVEYLGTKMSLLLTGLPLIAGWICVICASSATWLYISRILSGASMGMLFSCYPIYIGEISAPLIRGALVGLIINSIPLGTLFGHIMGPYMSMMTFGLISLVLTLCYISIFLFLPHSPHYYIRYDNMDKAEKAIQWYHPRCDVRSELEAAERFVKTSHAITWRMRLQEIKELKNRHAFMITILLFMFMQLSGLNTILFYMEIIIKNAMIVSIEPSSLVMIVTSIGIISGWIAVATIDRIGRRILLAVSSSGVTVGMLLLGLHFLLLDFEYDPEHLEWLLVLSLLIFMTTLFFGLIPVPSTMLSELFPSDLKSSAGFVASITSGLFSFVVTRTYHPMVYFMGEQCVFWIYAAIMSMSIIYSLVCVPETKKKTLEEIQNMMTVRRTQQSRVETEDTLAS